MYKYLVKEILISMINKDIFVRENTKHAHNLFVVMFVAKNYI